MRSTLSALRCNDLLGCLLLGTTQPAPPISKGIIQRPPCDVQNKRKRGGAARDVRFQLSLVDSRASCESDKSRAPSKFNVSSPTPELTGRAHNAGTDKLTMKAALFALRLNELLGSAPHNQARRRKTRHFEKPSMSVNCKLRVRAKYEKRCVR